MADIHLYVWASLCGRRATVNAARGTFARVLLGFLVSFVAPRMEEACMAEQSLPSFAVARLGSACWRAPRPIQCVRFAPDAGQIAVALDACSPPKDCGVLFYERASGKHTSTLAGRTNSVTSIVYTPDTMHLVSCDADGAIVIHDATNTAHVRLCHPDDLIASIAMSRDGAVLASAHHEPYIVRVWDWRSGREIARTPPADHWAHTLALSPDGSLLATSFVIEATVWDARSCTRIREFDGHALRTPFDRSKTVVSVDFTSDGKQLRVVRDQSVSYYDIQSGERRRCVPLTPGRYAGTFASTADSNLWAVGTFGDRVNNVEIWDANRGQRLHELAGHTDLINSLDFSRDGKALVSGSNDHTIRVWDVESGKTSFKDQGHQHVVRGICFADDSTLVSVGNDGRCRVWDVPRAAEKFCSTKHIDLQSIAIDRVRRVAFVGEETGLAEPSIVNLLDIATGKEIGTFAEGKGSASIVAWAPKFGKLFATSYKGAVLMWDTKDGRLLKRFGRFKNGFKGIVSLAVSPDEKSIAVGCGYGVVEVWSLEKFEPLRERLEHGDEFEGAPLCLTFSPDGSALAAGGEDGTIRLWRRSDYRLMGEFSANQDSINSIEFSPNARLLASAGSDGVVRLWDAQTHKQLCELPGHSGIATSVAFSPNGKLLASASYDTTILVWNVLAALGPKK